MIIFVYFVVLMAITIVRQGGDMDDGDDDGVDDGDDSFPTDGSKESTGKYCSCVFLSVFISPSYSRACYLSLSVYR